MKDKLSACPLCGKEPTEGRFGYAACSDQECALGDTAFGLNHRAWNELAGLRPILQKRAKAAEARAERAEAEVARLSIPGHSGGGGWTIDPEVLKRINDEASKSGWQSSMESTEAVMLAMVDAGLAIMKGPDAK
jgi:hypothetical protein